VPNYSFESPAVYLSDSFASVGDLAVSDWTFGGDYYGGAFNPSGTAAANNQANDYFNAGFPTQGLQCAFLRYSTTLTTASSLGPIQGGVTYILQVDVAAENGADLASYGLNLLANGQSFASFSGAADSIASGAYATETLSINVPVGSPLIGEALGIMLSNDDSASQGRQVFFDNVVLQAVPEPSSFVLLGFGALGLPFARRRLRKSRSEGEGDPTG